MSHPTNSVDGAEYTSVPQGTMTEVRAKGLDPRKVPSCAVPVEGQVKGCTFAERCATQFFGLPEFGGFGPKSPMPGSEGEGHEYITYDFTDRASGTRLQNCLHCYAFMAGMGDRYENQRKTGDRVVILGGPGTPYVALETKTEMIDGPDGKKIGKVVARAVDRVCPSRRDDQRQSLNTEYLDKLEENARRIAAARALEGAGGMRPTVPLSTSSGIVGAETEDDSVLDMGTPSASAAPVSGGKGASGNRRG